MNKIPPIYVCNIQEMQDFKDGFILENHPYNLLILCTAGEGYIITEMLHEERITPNTLIYASPAIFVAIRAVSDDFTLRFIGFNGVSSSKLLEYSGIGASHLISNIPQNIVSKFNSIFTTGLQDNYKKTSDIYSFICELYSVIHKPKTYADSITDAFTRYVYVNLNAGVDVSEFCLQNGISVKQLNEFLDDDVDKIIRRCRIEEAKLQIVTLPLDDLEALFKYCGFKSVKELEAEFFSYMNMMPEDFVRLYIPDLKNLVLA